MIARMWETRRFARVNSTSSAHGRRPRHGRSSWQRQASRGGELYRSDAQDRAVIVTRWASTEALAAGNEWFDLGAERFVAREPEAWEFTPVDLG